MLIFENGSAVVICSPIVRRAALLLVAFASWNAAAFAQNNVQGVPAENVNYYQGIMPIIEDHCVRCHRPGQVAPMSLQTYEEVRPWAKAIKKSILAGEMPPFHAEGPIGQFKNDPRLSKQEIGAIVEWIDAGLPKGDPNTAPPRKQWHDSQWTMGKPDLVTSLPEFRLQEKGKDYNICMYSDHVFPEDTWVRAIDIMPSPADSVHHAAIFVVGDDVNVPAERISNIPSFNILEKLWLTWTPGLMPRLPDPGKAVLIPKGSRIGAVVHFAPSYDAVKAKPKIGVYLANGTIEKTSSHMNFLIIDGLTIEPGDPEFTLSTSEVVTEDIAVTSFWFHMHYRGKSAKFIFHYPDGSQEIAAHVPAYDFNWQRIYYLAEPMHVPKGTRIECVNTWDNSAQNAANPDPQMRVRWGVRSEDEMGGGMLFYVQPLKEHVNVIDGIPQ